MGNRRTAMKIEQIAFGVKDPVKVIDLFSANLGLTEWIKDEVAAKGIINGKKGSNVAELHFNYQWGIELELLRYNSGRNWHEYRNPYGLPMFPSHQGYHCTEDEALHKIDEMGALNIGIIQEVYTYNHTNPAIAGKRQYHYIIFDSLEALGYDLKLIIRKDM